MEDYDYKAAFKNFKIIQPRNDKGEVYDPSFQLFAPNVHGTYQRFTDSVGDQLYESGEAYDHSTGSIWSKPPEWRHLTTEEIKAINKAKKL